jgi:photosystem II stability/assembly factor-like uncharacterized protein
MRRLLPVLLLSLVGVARADSVSPTLYQELSWRLIGPFRAGRVLAVTGVPGEASHFYFGSVNGGVWETRDAGRTWQPIFDSQPIGTIGALAVAPSDPKLLYVGSGEADMRSSIAQGNGMYRSSDGGATWSRIGLEDTQQIGRVLVHPQDPNTVYVAALGHPYAANAERGVFRTRDGGKSWQKILFKDADTGAIDVAMKPGDPRVVYAALWQTRRPPWNVYPPSNGPGSGLYRSTDGGDAWSRIDGHGMPEVHGRIGLALAPSRPDRVYAMVDAEQGGVYRSDDGGDHWTRTCGDQRVWQRGWYFGEMTVDPRDPDVVYALNTNLYRSSDGGRTFQLIKGSPGGDDYHQLWIDPADPNRQILGTDQGAVVTLDGGKTWSSWYNQPTAQLYRVVTDNRFPYRVYGAQQDSGAASVPSRTTGFDGINLTQFREITAGGESQNIAPDPLDPDLVYGGTVEKLDLRTQQTRSVDPTLAHVGRYRATWTLPLVFSPRDPHVLYFANQRLFQTRDGGEHWDAISPDLTREDPAVPATLDPATAATSPEAGPRRGVIYAIAPSRLVDHDIWVGTDDGLVWRTRDEGAHWTNVTPAGLGAWSKVGILEASPFDAESAYAAVDRHRLDDFRPYVYRTRDGGKSWSLVVDGIPSDETVNVVRADPVRRGLLFAGTERGVHVSFDDGDHWQSLQANLPVTSVRDVQVKGDDLVIATHGRGFYVLDDISPLRQAVDVAAGASAWLYRPATAYRVRADVWEGTPLPKDEPRAENPPAGAFVDYVLAKTPKEPVVLEILDQKGDLVRRYSSADPALAFDPARTMVAREWFRTPSRLSTTPGMHRFVWTLRYPLPAALARGNAFGNEDTTRPRDGLWAPPGNYTVALLVDGRRLSQPLSVAPDPRIHIDPEAYREQFALAREVESLRARVTKGMRETLALTRALAERRKGASPALLTRITGVEAKVWELAGTEPAANRYSGWWRRPASETSWRFVGDALGRLAEAIESADAAPSPDARAGFAELTSRVAAVEQAWSGLKTGDVAALDAELEAAGQAPLQP